MSESRGYFHCPRCGHNYGTREGVDARGVPLEKHACIVDLAGTKFKLLNVGCGLRPLKNAINLDLFPLPGVDVIRDVQERLPFADAVFDKVIAEDVIEHVRDPIRVVQELGRVLVTGGTLWIRGPDGRYPEIVWADLTHKRAFAPRTFDGFDPETHDGRLYGYYHGAIKFKRVKVDEKNKGLEFTLIRRSDDGSLPEVAS